MSRVTVEAGERGSTEHPDWRRWAPLRYTESNNNIKKTISREEGEESTGTPPSFPKHTHTYTPSLYTPVPPLPSAPPVLGLHRSAYVVTNDTFIFLQRVCVCKTAEVHQDVKYFGWATQVALEDNQMEV